MKRSWIITIAVCLLLAAVVAVAVLLPRTVPEAECSDVYRRYAGRDDVAAGYIRDYRINDTVSVDVTVLEAVTDSGWAAMCVDFHIPVVPKEYEEFFYDDSSFTVGYLSADMDGLGVDTHEEIEYVMAIFFKLHRIGLFRVRDDRHAFAVLHCKLKEKTI